MARSASSEPDENEAQNPGQGPGTPDFVKLKRWFISARDHSQEWRKEAEEDFDFAAGHQWNIDEEAVLKDQMRPPVAINRVGTVIDAAAGLEIQNRQEIRYLPRQMGQVAINDVLTAAAKWFRDQSFAEDEESDGFRDDLICGMAWIDTRLDYEEDPQGKSIDERIDPLEMYWDPVAKKRNLEDRRYQFRVKSIPLEDAKEMFPDHADDADTLDASWATNMPEGDKPHNQLEAKFYKNDQSGREAGNPVAKVTIVQAQWWDREACYTLADPVSGKVVTLSLQRYAILTRQLAKVGIPPLKAVKGRKRVFKQAFIGKDILESGPSPYPEGFTINCMTGKRDRNKNTFYGLVRVMKDPQRWANKFFSSLIQQFSTSGKGLLAETDAVVSVRNFEEDYATADAVKWLKTGGLAKVKEMEGAQMNQGVQAMMQYAIESIPQVTGVNIELQGTTDRDQPGILEYQRKMTGMTILADFFDGLRRFRKNQGKILLYYIVHFFSDGRLIKIDGEDGQAYIPLIKRMGAELEEYDVIIDDAPTSPNQKEHTWLLLTQLLPILKGIDVPPSLWAEFLKYSPLPDTLTQKVVAQLKQMAQKPPQMSPRDQAKTQIEQSRTQIEQAKAQSSIEKNKADAIAALAKAGVRQPGMEEQLMQAAVEALLGQAQSSQDHGEQLQQNAQEHAQNLQENEQLNQHALQQAQQAHGQALQQNAQQAALAPEPSGTQQ